MITFHHTFDGSGGRSVHVLCAECAKDYQELEVLVRETGVITSITINTGLHIVAEGEVMGRRLVCTSLRKRLSLTPAQLTAVQAKAKALLGQAVQRRLFRC